MLQYSRSHSGSTHRSPSLLAKQRRAHRSGFTLLEVLIATAVTLLMMISLAQIFKVIGDSMKQGRAALELNNRLRSVALRIRSDLEHLTVIPDPPGNPSEGQGYLKLYDGSMTDFSANSLDPQLNRLGDVDDIVMGTVQARDVWFTGKVPRFVLTGTSPAVPADLELVSIASQNAEIALFVQPTVAETNLNYPTISNPLRDPSYLAGYTDFFEDVDNNNVPDSYRLHYRVLLIRPDLNLPIGRLPASLPADPEIFRAGPQVLTLPDSTTVNLPSPLCDMSAIHSLCDLSVRRIYDPSDMLPGTDDYIAANSLEDLVNPANRFAHVQFPIPGTSSTTMPLLALSQAASAVYTDEPAGNLGGPGFLVGTGFLHPAFQLQHPPSGDTRVGEDILANDILAFDVKGFDNGVPLLPSLGPDGAFGIAGVNDDGQGAVDDAAEFGWAGSDDAILSPNDPGYINVLGSAPVGTGEYVDLGWGRKTVLHALSTTPPTPVPGNANLWSQLSGYSSTNYATNGAARGYSTGMYGSGQVITTPGGALHVLQPSFDTWTSSYEGDGILQAYRSGREGVTRISGTVALFGTGASDVPNAVPAWRRVSFDAANDGIDNNLAGGVDDVSELETMAPFPVKLRGMKLIVRMEDVATRQIKQMSIAREFVSQ